MFDVGYQSELSTGSPPPTRYRSPAMAPPTGSAPATAVVENWKDVAELVEHHRGDEQLLGARRDDGEVGVLRRHRFPVDRHGDARPLVQRRDESLDRCAEGVDRQRSRHDRRQSPDREHRRRQHAGRAARVVAGRLGGGRRLDDLGVGPSVRAEQQASAGRTTTSARTISGPGPQRPLRPDVGAFTGCSTA